ncbi:hypothetical protein ABTK34_19755, partial [Acinetobacter baumannii]
TFINNGSQQTEINISDQAGRDNFLEVLESEPFSLSLEAAKGMLGLIAIEKSIFTPAFSINPTTLEEGIVTEKSKIKLSRG